MRECKDSKCKLSIHRGSQNIICEDCMEYMKVSFDKQQKIREQREKEASVLLDANKEIIMELVMEMYYDMMVLKELNYNKFNWRLNNMLRDGKDK